MSRRFGISLTVILFTFAFGITPANAEDKNARIDKANEMIRIVKQEGILDRSLEMVLEGTPKAQRDGLRQILDEHIDRKILYAEWGRIAADIFTIEEMDALISFYSTSVGRSILGKRLLLNKRIAVSLLEIVTKSIQKAQKK